MEILSREIENCDGCDEEVATYTVLLARGKKLLLCDNCMQDLSYLLNPDKMEV